MTLESEKGVKGRPRGIRQCPTQGPGGWRTRWLLGAQALSQEGGGGKQAQIQIPVKLKRDHQRTRQFSLSKQCTPRIHCQFPRKGHRRPSPCKGLNHVPVNYLRDWSLWRPRQALFSIPLPFQCVWKSPITYRRVRLVSKGAHQATS